MLPRGKDTIWVHRAKKNPRVGAKWVTKERVGWPIRNVEADVVQNKFKATTILAVLLKKFGLNPDSADAWFVGVSFYVKPRTNVFGKGNFIETKEVKKFM